MTLLSWQAVYDLVCRRGAPPMPERTEAPAPLATAVAHWLDGAWPVQPLLDADHAEVVVPLGATPAQIAVLVAEVAAHGCYYDHAGRQWRLPQGGDRVIVVRGPRAAEEKP